MIYEYIPWRQVGAGGGGLRHAKMIAMSTDVCRNVRVYGRVQGVFFRASTQTRASELGVRGWVRNLPDGSVALCVAGPPHAVDALIAWAWQGPPRARVDDVEIEACRETESLPDPFAVRA